MSPSEIVIPNGKVYHLGLSKGQLAPNLILVGDPARSEKVAKHFDHIDHKVQKREFVTISGSYQNMPISVIGTGIGTDNVEIALVEAYTLLAFDFETKTKLNEVPQIKVLRIGTSGGVQRDIAVGTLGIAQYALGLDNVGLFYDHPSADAQVIEIEEEAKRILEASTNTKGRFSGKLNPYASKASVEMVKALEEQAQAFKQPFETGITVSTPGFYGPSGRYIQGLLNSFPKIKHALAALSNGKMRAINMEMESSLLFHLAHHLGMKVGTICPIISNPFTQAVIPDYAAAVDAAIQIGLEAMLALSDKD